MQDHFIPSGMRSERKTLFNSPFCFERISFANQGWATVQALWPFRASQRFGYRGLDCTSDPCIVIVRKMQATRSACLLHAVLWLDVGSYVTYVKRPPRSCGQQDGCSAGKRRNLPKKPLRSGLLRNSSGTIDQTRLVTLMLTSRCVTVSRPPVFSNGTIFVNMFHWFWTDDARSSGCVSCGTREGRKRFHP